MGEVQKDKSKSGAPSSEYGSNPTLTYNSYLKVPELTRLQNPLSDPIAHDEMLFIIIHQVYELWFKLANHEITAAVRKLQDNEIVFALKSMNRIHEILRVLVQQIDVLETMTPVEFNKFRSNINPASGFQSLQFREFEILAGHDPADYDKFAALDPEWKPALEARKAQTTLRDAFLNLLKSRKLIVDATPEAIEAAILEIYGNEIYGTLQALCEDLIKFDELVSLWRYRHVQMVERMIGMKPGTGGSLGVNYLATTLRKRFFPELWKARTAFT